MLSIIAFVIYFSIGLAPIPFVIAAEIFPQHLRDMFTSISVSTYYSMTAIVSLVFGELYPIIGVSFRNNMFSNLFVNLVTQTLKDTVILCEFHRRVQACYVTEL